MRISLPVQRVGVLCLLVPLLAFFAVHGRAQSAANPGVVVNAPV